MSLVIHIIGIMCAKNCKKSKSYSGKTVDYFFRTRWSFA